LRVVADLSGVTDTGNQTVPAQVYLDGSSDMGEVGSYQVSETIRRGRESPCVFRRGVVQNMIQTARVKRLLDDGRAEVTVPRKSVCGHDCSNCSGGCSEMLVQMEVTTVAANPVHAEPGDTVRVESDSGHILKIAAVVYLV